MQQFTPYDNKAKHLIISTNGGVIWRWKNLIRAEIYQKLSYNIEVWSLSTLIRSYKILIYKISFRTNGVFFQFCPTNYYYTLVVA
jgi:hypothetical protein